MRLLFFTLILGISQAGIAGHPIHPIVIVPETPSETVKNEVRIEAKGVALGIATANHHFDWGTYSLQGSFGFGAYDRSEAVSFAFGKRLCEKCGLLNMSAGMEDGKTGVGFGYNWRF